MAKIRTIKREFWHDEKIGSLPVEARLLYIGTWSIADDNGVLRGNPAYIRSQLFAYDEEVTAADVRRWLELLTAERMLVPFTHRGERYLLVRRFRDHQKIDARYATELIPFAEVEAALAEAEAANALTDNAPRETHVKHTCAPREPHVEHVLGVGVGVGVGVDTHTPVGSMKGGVGGNTATVASEVAVADDVGPAAAAEDDDDDDWYGVVEVSPATSAAAPADVFAQRAAEIRRLIGERYPQIAAMREPLRDDQLRWIAERYALEDVRRILSDMDDKRVYDAHSRSYRTKTFNAFMAFADCDRMVGGVAGRAGGAGGMAPSRPSKRLYTYEEMCDEIPSRARQEDFTMVEVGGRKLWQKRVVV